MGSGDIILLQKLFKSKSTICNVSFGLTLNLDTILYNNSILSGYLSYFVSHKWAMFNVIGGLKM